MKATKRQLRQYGRDQELVRFRAMRHLAREYGLDGSILIKLTGLRVDIPMQEGGTVRGSTMFEGYRV